jgi:hypothetical protein
MPGQIQHQNKYRRLNPALMKLQLGMGGGKTFPNPTAWWKINEGTGTEFLDYSGNDNFIAFSSSPSLGNWNTVAGLPGSAFVFDGDANNVNFPAGQSAGPTNFNGSTPFSVSAWVYPSNLTALITIIAAMSPGLTGWAMQMNSAELEVYLVSTLSAFAQVTGAFAFSDNTLYQVAFTYTGNGSATGIALYVDGAPITTVVGTNTLDGGNTQPDSVPSVGYSAGNEIGQAFLGAIADIRIYDVLLTSAQISTLYSTGPQ